MLYENIFIVRQDMSPTQVDALTHKFVKIFQEQGGTVSKTEYCGLKNLAYMIKKNRKGHYVLMNLEGSAEALAELERNMRLSEDLIRHLSVRVEEHETGPSVLLKSSRYSNNREGYDDHHGNKSSGSRREDRADKRTQDAKEGDA